MPAPLVIELPDPSLVVLIGAAGAGKSTFAARHFAPDEVLSSDAYREAVSGDAADQRATRHAFAALHRTLARRMLEGRFTVVDATNVQAAARAALLRPASAAGIPVIAIVLDLPAALVMSRNAGRPGRVVPEDAVRHQLGLLRHVVAAGLDAERFAAVLHLRDPEAIDAVRVVRRPTPSPEAR